MNEENLIKSFYEGLKPEPELTVSEWADQHRMLSSASSAEPGRWRTSRTPYLREIMDHLSANDVVQEVIFMKGAQIGATEAAANCIGYYIGISPSPILFVQPTKDMMEYTSKSRIQPMIDASPQLNAKIKPARSRDAGNTILKKEFPGGILSMTGANSAAGLRSMPIKTLILDEVDAYPHDLDGEGDPIDLARKRTATFSKRKIFMLSTPTIEGESAIEKNFNATDQRYYHVPCPHCGSMITFEFDHLHYDYDPESQQASNIYYECQECGGHIEERMKGPMLKDGRWIQRAPKNANPIKIGYHLNALYSPYGWYSWKQAAEEHETAKNDIPKLKTFTNTVLGLSYAEKGEKPEWQNLYNRRELYTSDSIPADVAFLTCGVDVQKDRLELEIVGWCAGKISYSIDYRVLAGPTAGDDSLVWAQLSSVLLETFTREDGAQMIINMMCIDTGYNTSEVYSFCHRYDPIRVVPVKGQDNQLTILSAPKPVNVNRKGKAIGKIKVWHVGVSLLKSELYGWLKLQQNEDGSFPAGYCHFPQYSIEYFKGITAEEVQMVTDKKGKKTYAWVKKYPRNEPLDCFSSDTEVLTYGGWKLFSETTMDDIFATVNLDTDLIEYHKAGGLVKRAHHGEMVQLLGYRIDLLVTPNHRMVTYKKEKIGTKWHFDVPPKIILAKDLTIHHQIKCAATWRGNNEETFVIPASFKSSDNTMIEPERMLERKLFAAFMGWFLSEGSLWRYKKGKSTARRVEICQLKTDNIETIASIIGKLPWKASYNKKSHKFFICSKQLYDYLSQFGKQGDRFVPQWIKDSSPDIINAFLDNAIAGDGYVSCKEKRHRAYRRYYTISKRLADDIQELFLKIGKATNMYMVDNPYWEVAGHRGYNARRQYHVAELNKTKASLDTSIGGKRHYLGKTVPYNGMVYCATVPNGTLIVRRNGKAAIAGNCRNYSRAAASMIGMDVWNAEQWEALRSSYLLSRAPNQETKTRKSSYWDK